MLGRLFENKKILAIALIVLGLATRLFFLANPAEVVFDEVHFGKFVSSYFTGRYHFDIHPPLGKMIIATGAWLGGYGNYVSQNGVFDFRNIGDDYGSMPYLWFRVLPALAGALIPLVIFLFASELGLSRLFSFLAGLFVVFENSVLVESRLVLMDAFLILFGFLGLYLFFLARNKGYPFLSLLLSGSMFALSVSIKWTGLGFWGAAGLIFAWDLIYCASQNLRVISPVKSVKDFVVSRWKYFVFGLFSFLVIPALVYFSVFQIHFAMLPDCPKPEEGNGCDFMSKEFRQNELNRWREFSELNQKMWSYNKGISASHEYGSKALGWPLMIRSVYYWVQNVSEGINSRIYMIGNPVNWFLGLFGIFAFLFVWIPREKKIILGLLFLANFLPFILVERVLFLYHYLFALIISFVIFCFVAESLTDKLSEKKLFLMFCPLILIILFGFVFFAPLSYGLPLTDGQFEDRQWSGLWFSGNSQLKQICEKQGCSVLKWIVY